MLFLLFTSRWTKGWSKECEQVIEILNFRLQLYIDRTWKAAQQGRRHCSKTAIKKPDYGLQLHMGTKIVLFGEMSSGLMKQTYNCLAIMTIVMFGGKRGRLARQRTQITWCCPAPCFMVAVHHVVGVLCCRWDWCTSQNRWHHEGGRLGRHIWSNISRHQSGS